MVEVAPRLLAKVTPPSVLTCHCTVGVGCAAGRRGEGHRVAGRDGLAGRIGGDDRGHGGGYRERSRLAGGAAGGVGEDGLVFVAVIRALVVKVKRGRSSARNVGEGDAAIGADLPLHRRRRRATGCRREGHRVAGGDGLAARLGGDDRSHVDREVAGWLVALPATLVKTASYSLPSSAALVVKVSVVEVAPGISAKVAPPSVLTCHCTVGVGVAARLPP